MLQWNIFRACNVFCFGTITAKLIAKSHFWKFYSPFAISYNYMLMFIFQFSSKYMLNLTHSKLTKVLKINRFANLFMHRTGMELFYVYLKKWRCVAPHEVVCNLPMILSTTFRTDKTEWRFMYRINNNSNIGDFNAFRILSPWE